MKNQFLLILTLLILIAATQWQCKTYVNQQNEKVKIDKYQSAIRAGIFCTCQIGGDDSRKYMLFPSLSRGYLDREVVDSVRQELIALSGVVIDTTDVMVVNYFPARSTCINDSIYVDALSTEIDQYHLVMERLYQVKQFSVYQNGADCFEGKKYWVADAHRRIEKRFFPCYFPCQSYIIIHPSGKYWLRRGGCCHQFAIYNLIKNPSNF